MIRRIVDFALREKVLVVSVGALLLIWGVIAFHRLPIEAYPDVAAPWVQVITQWPGHAAEEVEQQVTVPIEIQMNGIGHMIDLRSQSLFGLSSVTMIFDDNSNAIVIVGGLSAALAISVFLLPTLYVWFARADDPLTGGS